MPQKEQRFTARGVDAQFEQYAQAAPSASDTPDSRVVESLQRLYGEQIQQEQQSLERMRQRLALSVAARQQEQLARADDERMAAFEVGNVPEKLLPRPVARPQHRPWLRGLEQCVAVLLVLAIIAGWFALAHMPHSSSTTPVAFSDASAQPLGAPISTINGNFSGVRDWSPDGHTLALLQVDTQKHDLLVRLLNVTTNRSTMYPVLDASWLSALKVSDPFQILMGRYLLAMRAAGKNQATLEIWDITGQRAVTTQTIPAQIGPNGQVEVPWIVSSHDEQKLALFAPDGTVSIWDVASGQKLLTCAGKISYGSYDSNLLPPIITWYNHDQSLLFYPRNSDTVVAWNTVTGARLFSEKAVARYGEPLVSPDNHYLALPINQQQAVASGTSFHIDGLEILDAHSGQTLHSYQLHLPTNTEVSFTWLSDNQRLLMLYLPYSNTGTPTSAQSQAYSWNVFTDQKTLLASFPQNWSFGTTEPDRQYLILSSPDGRTMEIWQTSNGHEIATVATPGVYARTDSYFYQNNRQMIVGLKGNFDIWDVASGKLLYKYHGSTPFSIAGVDSSIVFWSPDGKYLIMLAGTSSTIGNGAMAIWRMP